ncbi:hypothetical protein Q7C36_022398 [Tachysurus vachellii]|uniref:Uncharacterized protein n=1 Tax=Tachysurus vachellii TaxID=175792 RepID=A0AA88IKI1_TACVA|nr:hypothetical protein Q7C36_022398 [Tachysurus vachellii]
MTRNSSHLTDLLENQTEEEEEEEEGKLGNTDRTELSVSETERWLRRLGMPSFLRNTDLLVSQHGRRSPGHDLLRFAYREQEDVRNNDTFFERKRKEQSF